jgi:FkbM family methyltransferase
LIEKQFGLKTNSSTFFDIGSNIGNHSVFLSNFFKKIYSFEPNPTVYAILRLNCKEIKNIQTFNLALGASKAKRLFINHNANYANGHFIEFHKDAEAKKIYGPYTKGSKTDNFSVISVQVEKLDSFCIQKNLKPDFLKIDVEGAEIEVLRGAKNYLTDQSPIILIELSRDTFSNKKNSVVELLSTFGYKNWYTYKYKIDLDECNSIIRLVFRALKSLIIPNFVEFRKVSYPKFGTHRFIVATK